MMTTIDLLQEVNQVEIESQELSNTVTKQVANILEESQQVSDSGRSAAKYWYYRIPFAGVRCYSFEESDAR